MRPLLSIILIIYLPLHSAPSGVGKLPTKKSFDELQKLIEAARQKQRINKEKIAPNAYKIKNPLTIILDTFYLPEKSLYKLIEPNVDLPYVKQGTRVKDFMYTTPTLNALSIANKLQINPVASMGPKITITASKESLIITSTIGEGDLQLKFEAYLNIKKFDEYLKNFINNFMRISAFVDQQGVLFAKTQLFQTPVNVKLNVLVNLTEAKVHSIVLVYVNEQGNLVDEKISPETLEQQNVLFEHPIFDESS